MIQMLVDNQTLTEIIKNAIHASITPDYTGWTIGILGIIVGVGAIVITLFIHDKQKKLSTRLDTIHQEAIGNALERIRNHIFYCKNAVRVQMKMVDMGKGTDNDKLVMAQAEMKGIGDSFSFLADSIMKEADFVRVNIKPELYTDIERLVRHIKLYVDEKMLSTDFGSATDSIVNWQTIGKNIVQHGDTIIAKILTSEQHGGTK